jgi:aspartyl-tRNA(Asn)/glutamyl-tRNA(Gln) amidotransferase subunit A
VGFKPTFGAVPTRGVIPFSWTLDHVGSICRTVADAALLFGVMSGTRNEGVEPEASDLRFAMAEEWLAACTPAVAAGIRRVGDALESAGATRVPVQLPDLDAAAAVAGAIFLAEGGAVHAETLARSPEAYCSPTVSFLRQSQRVSGVDYFRAQRHRAALKADFARLYADHGLDLLIAPALPCSPPAVAAVHVELPEGSVEMRAAMTRFTRPFNLTGQPVLCLPVAMDDQAMAVNAQLVGAEGADFAVLRWGQLVEAIRSGGKLETG